MGHYDEYYEEIGEEAMRLFEINQKREREAEQEFQKKLKEAKQNREG